MSICRQLFACALIMGAAVALNLLSGSTSLHAHTVFKKALEKSYTGVKVSCNACHVKGKSKKERNEELGKVFYEEMKELNLTDEWKSKKGSEKKAYQTDVMIPAFKKALEIVKAKKKGEDGETWHKLIETAGLDGLKLKDTEDEDK